MIPLSLRLHNFMSYGEKVAPFDFNAFRVACLCGDNGHGKSALLDAITWALWGKSRAKSEDDLVQLGRLDMEVELEFALGSDRYCVLRKRQIRVAGRRRVATPILELQIYQEGLGYRPMTGDTVGQTQALIQKLLRIDYETFINSAFIVQGRADEFTTKNPGDRKRILADLLGLERYNELERQAREEGRRCAAERTAIQATIAAIEAELSRRGQHEAQLSQAAAEIGQAEEERRAADAELARWRLEQREIEARTDELRDVEVRRDTLRQECDQLADQLGRERAAFAQIEERIARGPDARAAVTRLKALRAEESALAARAQQLLALTAEKGRLENAIAAERETIATRLARASADVERHQPLSAQIDTYRRQHAEAVSQLAQLQAHEVALVTRRDTLRMAEAELRALRDTNARLKAEMQELRERLDMLGKAGAACPVCQGALSAAARQRLTEQLHQEGKKKADEYRANEKAIAQFDQSRVECTAAIADLESHLAGRSAIEQRVATLMNAQTQAQDALTALGPALEAVAALDAQLRKRAFLPDEHRRLDEIIGLIDATGYDAGEHARVKSAIDQIGDVEALLAAVTAAEATVETTRERITTIAAQLETRRAGLEECSRRLLEIETMIERRAQIDANVERASQAVDRAIERSQKAQIALGAAQQRLAHCGYLDEQKVERQKEAARAAEERAIFEELATAFGRNGIQAMIIESVIPEIESEANELLQRLTDGQLNLALRMQREAKVGDNVIETLDIQISDAFGTRNYEMYSGGEAFRIDFAIRIALSKLLVRRAGAQLQLLVIDEGFGSQDATGRERLVEAIGAVSAEFEKILVVTHIQELKDAFPYRIDVVKTPEGSQIVYPEPVPA